MNSLWRKAWADLWQERTRCGLVMLAIALGMIGFISVMSSYTILTRELNDGYRATKPASSTLYAEHFDEASLQAVRALPEIELAETRRVVQGKIQAGTASWQHLRLFVLKDFAQIPIAKITPERGAWPPALGEILIERDAFQVANTSIGQQVQIKLGNAEPKRLQVAGSVHDIGQAQARMDRVVYGYISRATLAQLGEADIFNELKIVVRPDAAQALDLTRSQAMSQAVSQKVKELLSQRGINITSSETPPPGEHPHSKIMGTLLLVMAGFGLFVLALAGVLVLNLMLGLMAQQQRQIAVMHALGGSMRQIAQIYLSQALFLGLASLLLALPLGLFGGRILSRALAVFLNVDLHSYALPWWLFALLALIGPLLAVLAASVPIWLNCRRSVQANLSPNHASTQTAEFGARRFDQWLNQITASLALRQRDLAYALRNCFRQRLRLLLTLSTLAIAGMFFLAALNVRSSIIHTIDLAYATRPADLSVDLTQVAAASRIQRALQANPGIFRSESWLKVNAILEEAKPSDSSHAASHDTSFHILALPANSQLYLPQLAAGDMLRASDEPELLLNQELLAKLPGVAVGSRLSLHSKVGERDLGTQSWRVAGIVREAFSPPAAYALASSFDNQTGELRNQLQIVLAKPQDIENFSRTLKQDLQKEQISVRGIEAKGESRYALDQHMLMIYYFLLTMAAILALVGGLGLATSMSLNVMERRREMGVLRALGASPMRVCRLIVLEGMLVGAISIVFALLAAIPFSIAVGNLLVGLMLRGSLDFQMEPLGIVLWLAIALLLSLLASFVPAWQAGRSSVRQALANE